jgi:acyl dehydratase
LSAVQPVETDTTFIPPIFDRSRAGFVTPPMMVLVERDRIRFFSKILGIIDPVHHDVSAARAQGYPDLLAPPSFLMVIEALAEEERDRRGELSIFSVLRCDFRYLLHGNETYSYSGDVFAGDELTFVSEVVGFVDKKGGALEIAQIVNTVSHATRGDLIRADRTLIHRLG